MAFLYQWNRLGAESPGRVQPGGGRLPVGGPVGEVFCGHGLRDAMALYDMAAHAHQQIALFLGLHSLSDDAVAKRARQANHALYDRLVGRVLHHAAHIALIEFELIDRPAAQVGQ